MEGDTVRSYNKSDSWPGDWCRIAFPDSSLCQSFPNALHFAADIDNATRHCPGAPLRRGLSHSIFYSRYTLEALFEPHWQDQQLQSRTTLPDWYLFELPVTCSWWRSC